MTQESVEQMTERLRLFSILHYVLGALTACFSMFPIFHLAIGLIMIVAPDEFCSQSNGNPEIIGWFFIVIASVFILTGLILAAVLVMTGRFISKRKHHTFCLVICGIECCIIPFGTILGVFSLIALSKTEAKKLFE